MTKLWKSVGVLGATVMGLALSAPVLAVTSGVGPYYATPSWDQKLTATRFIVLTDWSSAAVLDRETGLVWEQSPSTAIGNWGFQSFHCISLNTGGRAGWRLPTIQEVMSIVDRSQSNPALPSGHPFTVQSSSYWSATSYSVSATVAISVDLSNGFVNTDAKSLPVNLAWCVRGGQGVDPQ